MSLPKNLCFVTSQLFQTLLPVTDNWVSSMTLLVGRQGALPCRVATNEA